MKRHTNLVLTLAAFGLFSQSQLALAQQTLQLDSQGRNQAQSGYVTFNKFLNQASPAQPASWATQPAAAPAATTAAPVQPAAAIVANTPPPVDAASIRIQQSSPTTPAPTVAPTVTSTAAASALPQTDLITSAAGCSTGVDCAAPVSAGSAFNESMYQQTYTSRPPAQYGCDDPCSTSATTIYEQLTSTIHSQPSIGSSSCEAGNMGCGVRRPIYFGYYEAMFGLPYYSDTHSASVINDGTLTRVEPYDYDLVYATKLGAGFESTKGPGGLLEYFDMSANSNLVSVVQPSGISTVTGTLNMPSVFGTSLAAPVNGRLDATAQQDVSSIRVEAFKRIYWPISTLSGGLGLNYTTFDQQASYASFANATSTTALSTLTGERRYEGIGPTFSMQYHRPIGHSYFAAIGGIQAGLLFGSDDWAIVRDNARVAEAHASRMVTNLNVNFGLQYAKPISQCNNGHLFVRTSISGQNWMNVGSFQSTNADFGFLSANLAIGISY